MRTNILAAFVLCAAAGGAAAQTAPQQPMDMDEAYAAARNQLGVLEYCQTAGHIDAAPVEIQNRMIGMIPTPADTAPAEAAYAKGKEGTISSMGMEQTLADTATQQSTTEDALCSQIGELVQQAGAQLPPA